MAVSTSTTNRIRSSASRGSGRRATRATCCTRSWARRVKPADAALATELTMGVLRWRRLLDFLLERHLEEARRAGSICPWRSRCGWALYQLRFLEQDSGARGGERIGRAGQDARGRSSAASLVNAVLAQAGERSAVARREISAARTRAQPSASEFCIRIPTWMVERWLSRFGEARTVALLRSKQSPAAAELRAAGFRPSATKSSARSRKRGLRVEPGAPAESRVRRERRKPGAHGGVSRGPNFDSGRGLAGDSAAARRSRRRSRARSVRRAGRQRRPR